MSGKGSSNSDPSPNGQHYFFSRTKSKAKEDPTASLRETNARLEAQVSMWKAKYAALDNYCELLEPRVFPQSQTPAAESTPQARRRYFEHFLFLGASSEDLARHAVAGVSSSAGPAMVDAVKLLCFPSDPPFEKLEEFAFPAGQRAAHAFEARPSHILFAFNSIRTELKIRLSSLRQRCFLHSPPTPTSTLTPIPTPTPTPTPTQAHPHN